MTDANWKCIYTTDKPYQAEIIKQMLEENGIEAVVMNKQDSSYQTFGVAEVYTTQENEETAKELINTFEI